MKHLRIFNSTAEFEATKPSMDTPYVVLDEETGEVIYCNIPSITEDEITGGPYVDLGLSVKWASCNLGADKPCEYGKYYQWGDTVGYTGDEAEAHSTWATAPFNNGSSSYDSTYFASVKDTVCPGGILANDYDAVYQATNGAAHMPTKAQIEELTTLPNEWCTCTFLGDDHASHTVYGRKFTGNGNTLFIPAAGFFSHGSFCGAGSDFDVWSGTLYSDYPGGAGYLLGDDSEYYSGNDDRFYGYSVRGVKD